MPPRRKQQYRHLPAFILLALAEEPIHGGAVLNVLSQRIPLFKPDSAAVYRTLQQLEDEAQVVSSWDTSGSGPARRVYRLTQAGWDKLEGWREDIEMRMANLRYFLDTYAEVRSHRKV
ncbi:helix-turn-helix transcriptional regulator [Geomonas anaerohicana]|uniref:Helix-turn-helix transcriptional regulator n=1 Tax=Geomonas anaerohicana TaxID=2798583 RepID=A0ABS0YKG6_9BACT|nr:helix-turn-helix transcriptional regulator [Geomonas anaerohicana]MBJ6752752.1 helix-turn-helix transcriptional regulator [Geomonas anaerohicana]